MYRFNAGSLALALVVAATALVVSPAEAAVRRQPDVMVRLGDGPWVGAHEYFRTAPFETTSELEVAGAGSHDLRLRIVNRGNVRDSFNVFANRWSTAPAECGFQVVRRGVDLTAKMTTTGYVEKDLAAGDRITYRVRISTDENDGECSLELRAASTRNFEKRDVVIATVANTA